MERSRQGLALECGIFALQSCSCPQPASRLRSHRCKPLSLTFRLPHPFQSSPLVLLWGEMGSSLTSPYLSRAHWEHAVTLFIKFPSWSGALYPITTNLVAQNNSHLLFQFLWVRSSGTAQPGSLQGHNQGVGHGWVLIWRVKWGRIHFQAVVADSRIGAYTCHWEPTSGPCHMGLSPKCSLALLKSASKRTSPCKVGHYSCT